MIIFHGRGQGGQAMMCRTLMGADDFAMAAYSV